MPKYSLALKVATLFLQAGTTISILLSREKPEVIAKAEEILKNEIYQKLLVNAPQKSQDVLKNFLIWHIIKNKNALDNFLMTHPDFLTDKRTISRDLQKLYGKLKDSQTTFDDIEREIYPNISKFKDFKKSENPHFKVLNIPGMPPGQKWVLITDEDGNPVSKCQGEADAMGHCGVSYGGELLSLRDDLGRSHLTVDRTPDKELLQLKAQGNRVIRENYNKFRPYIKAIKALLLSDEIQSIRDHVLSDISILDLISEHDQKLLEDVMKKKPSLISKREREVLLPLYEKYWKDELTVKELLERLRVS